MYDRNPSLDLNLNAKVKRDDELLEGILLRNT